MKCLTEPNGDVESESETPSSSSLASGSGISTYSWCAGLGGIGFLETSYLTYLKLTNSDAFCPIGGGSCGDVLNSDYASVFGILLCRYLIITSIFFGLQLLVWFCCLNMAIEMYTVK